MKEIKHCPIATAMKHIGRKWAVEILRDLHMGKKKFKEFLGNNPDMSTKMLSHRLKELERDGIVEKVIASKTPLKIEYKLTNKGADLNRVLYELAMFSFKHYSEEVFDRPVKFDKASCDMLTRKSLGIK